MRLIILVVIILLAAGGAYLYLHKPDVLKKGMDQVRGFGPAQSADEAVDKFRSAIKARDYQTAAGYVSGGFATQLQRGGDAAKALGESIDGLTALADKFGISLTQKVKTALALLDPSVVFAANFDSAKVTPKDSKSASANLTYPGGHLVVEVKKDADAWQIALQEPKDMHKAVDTLNSKYKDYCRSLDKVKEEIRSKSIITKDDLESRLISELDLARK